MLDIGFDKRWEKHPKPQATTEEVFWNKTGWKQTDLIGKCILDAACGCGRFSAISARYSPYVTGFDISPHAVAAARENVPSGEFHEDDLLDIKHIPENQFDIVFALGTLHHTGDTHRAFQQVAKRVKKGGEFAVWLYCQPVSDELLPVIQFLHEITREVEPETLHRVISKYAVQVRDIYDGEWGPLQQILQVSGSKDDEECISDTFDWHCPRYRDWHGEDELKRWFAEEGFDVIWTGDFPTTVRGVKL